MKNIQYPKDLISAANIMKNHRHDDYEIKKISARTRNTKNLRSKSEWTETEEELQPIFQIPVNFREGMCYCCGNTGNILPDCHDATSTSKDKWAFKTATQHFCAESQNSESQYGEKTTINQQYGW